MKSNEVSSENNWNFSRVLRISVKVALVYSLLKAIWIFLFGSPVEEILSFYIPFTEPMLDMDLPWNAWKEISSNALSGVLFGISLYWVFLFTEWLVKYFKLDSNETIDIYPSILVVLGGIVFLLSFLHYVLNSPFGIGTSLLFGFFLGIFAGAMVALCIAILVSLIKGGIWLIKKLVLAIRSFFSSELWKNALQGIGRGISYFFNWLVR